MNAERCHKCEGYEQGFSDAKRSGGKLKKTYIKNLFKSETQNLSQQESLLYETGWQEGFSDAINGILKGLVVLDNCMETNYFKDPSPK